MADPKRRPFRRFSTCALVLLAAAGPAAGTDWPQWQGGAERSALRSAAGVLPAGDGDLRLVEVWRRPFGSGYSGVSIAGDLVVSAMAADGDDVVVALAAEDGRERWRAVLEPTYEGHDGSHDGPLSTPAIAHGMVFALSARGQLVALDVHDGRERWRRSLPRDHRVKKPHYGFATSPLVTGGMVIVQGGGRRGPSLLAFDARSGELAWTGGKEPTRYSSPTRMTLAGVPQVVVAGTKAAIGVRLSDGRELWRFPVPEGDFTPLPLGDDRLLISTDSSAVALRVVAHDDGLDAESLWPGDELADPWGPAVYEDGVIYAEGDDEVLAIDVASGEVRWRHPNAGGTLTRFDGHLAQIDYGTGALRLIEAGPSRHRDRGTFELLHESQSLVGPSVAGGRLYLRGRKEIVAVRFVGVERD